MGPGSGRPSGQWRKGKRRRVRESERVARPLGSVNSKRAARMRRQRRGLSPSGATRTHGGGRGCQKGFSGWRVDRHTCGTSCVSAARQWLLFQCCSSGILSHWVVVGFVDQKGMLNLQVVLCIYYTIYNRRISHALE